MSQQASDLPRSVQIIGRYRTLIGLVALLGAFVGIVLAALNPPASSSQALGGFPAPPSPPGAISGGPLSSPASLRPMLPTQFPPPPQLNPSRAPPVPPTVT